ncbi:hypothetical protein EDB83DRAFT_1153650 [Lactarius deliciosus]|nr:hypothetical protein EDB83DRAFT_1153650 [Lactarius deliciosus]
MFWVPCLLASEEWSVISVLFASVLTVSPHLYVKGCWPGSALPSLLLARPQHAAPHHYPPCLLCHACVVEGDRPRRAAVHDKSLHVSLVRDVQQTRWAYPKLHPGNIHRGRLYPNSGYAVRRYPSECQVQEEVLRVLRGSYYRAYPWACRSWL